ncbi:TraM recognition domain-containing protein [Sphingobium sp. HBC34]|uniref:TraM recognition domain-containing protein n=1 Tax=Sphingobium cyanobacteriorum TaxID=3063954 RepID=A0ABT8ZR05_9SPHN|nr:TraM recognition domain-containing protein [Sphingobium sp. HBC34]MDO7836974.1 TraM recognition domain-containing protein [Sphingobium sp. HBC34]
MALARQRLIKGQRHPCFLYADEAQHFVTPSMASLLTEGRKYGLGLVLAHQNLRQIQGSPVEAALLGNAYSRILFRVGDDDARKLAAGLSFFEAHDLQALGRGEAVVRLGSAGNDCNLATRALSVLEAGKAEARCDAVRAASRKRFAAPIARIEPPQRDHEMSVAPHPSDLQIAAVQPVQMPREVKARPAVLSPPTRPEREHLYLQHLIARLGEERGFRAIMEEPVGEGRVDVSLRRDPLAIAIEVSVTTSADHEVENVRKCLTGTYSHVAIIVPHARKRAAIAMRVQQIFPNAGVAIMGPDEIVAFLDQFAPLKTEEKMVRGYKVRVKRNAIPLNDRNVATIVSKIIL